MRNQDVLRSETDISHANYMRCEKLRTWDESLLLKSSLGKVGS